MINFKMFLQVEALSQLKRAFPDGRFWIKADATDLKICLQESVRGQWNGDSQLHPVSILKIGSIWFNSQPFSCPLPDHFSST